MSLPPEDIFRRLIEEGFNLGDLGVVDELASPGFVEHQNFGPAWPTGREALRATIRSLRSSFPDLVLSIEDVVAAGEMVWARIEGKGTNSGPFLGFPPTGKSMHIDVIDIVRVVDGQLVEHWGVADRLGALLQLGLAPRP